MGSELLPVCQDDRDAAATLWRAVGNAAYSEWQADWMADGTADPGPVVQAFACHRTRSRTITKEQVEEAAKTMYDLTSEPEHGDAWEHVTDKPWGDNYRNHALAAARAFGLTVEG